MAGAAKPRTRIGKRIKDMAADEQKLYSLVRRTNTPTQTSVAFSAGKGADPGGGQSNRGYLQTQGDTMVGPIAFFVKLISISSGAIDIGITTDNYTSRVIVAPESGSTDDLTTITGANFAGQLLFVQGVETDTITIKTTGNIETINGADFALEDDDIIIFMFDTTDNKWQQVTTGKQGVLGAGNFISASISADQTTNLLANDHVEFDTTDSGSLVLQTGAGQADGIFELKQDKTYSLNGLLRPEFSGATGSLVVAWYDITNTAELGKRAIYEPTTQTADDANQPVATFIVTPATDITVELRIISVTALTALANEYCIATIFGVGGGSGGGSGSVSFPITPTINDHGNVGTTTEDIDLSLSTGHVHKITLTGNPTLTFSNPPASGTQIEFEIEFIQDGTGNRTVTYPATVVETVSISQTADSTTIVTFRTNDGGTNYHAVPALRGSISLSGSTVFASRQLDNLDTPLLNVGIDCNSKTFSNWVGWTAGVGQTFDVGGTGGTWNLPSGDTHTFRVNGADQIIIQENAINVNSHSLTNYIGYTAGVGQTVVLDGTGEVHTLPTGDTYDYKINGTSEFTISSLGVGVAESLQFQDSATTPTTNGEMQRNGTDVIVYTGGSAVNLSNIAILPFDDNQVIIQDEADNTKTLTFNLSLQDASAANLLSWASGGSRTHTFSSTSGTLAQLNLAQTFTTTQTFSATVGIDMQNKKIDLDGDSDTSISSPSDDAMTFEVGGDTRFLLTASSADFVVPLDISSNALTGVSTLSMDGAGIIKSASASEIAFQVTNDSISIGIEGTVQIPQKTGSSSTAAQADTDFGDATGCMGIYMNDTSKVHLLVVKQPDGAWAAVVLTDNVLV